jgi:hypothetical protein
MAVSPELESKVPGQAVPEEIQQVQDRFSPEVERQLQELNAQVQPSAPQQTQDDQGNPLTQSVGDTTTANVPTVQVPVGQEDATSLSHGSISDSRTWKYVGVPRKIKIALHNGWKLIIGQKN